MKHKDIVIFGYPKSGNTWVAKLVSNLADCPMAGFLGEPENNDVGREGMGRISPYQVFKSHHTASQLLKSFKGIHKAIYVVRNPMDIAVSGAHFFQFEEFKSFRNIAVANEFEAMFETVCFGSSLSWCGIPWRQHVADFMANATRFIVVRYEDLIQDPVDQLKKISTYLNLERSEEEIAKCIEAQNFAFVKRKAFESGDERLFEFLREGKVGSHHSVFSEKHIKLCREVSMSQMTCFGY